MYLDCLVEIPETKGKLAYLKRGKTTYVYYETDRTYDPGKQYTAPKRVVIGQKSEANPSMLQPNENFLRFFPCRKSKTELPEAVVYVLVDIS